MNVFPKKKVASSLNFTSYLRTTMKNDTNNVGVELYAWGKLLQPLAIPSKMPFHSSLCATNLHVVTSQSPMLVQLLKVILWKSQATFVGRHNILHNHLYKVRCTCMFVCVKKHAILRNKLHIYIYIHMITYISCRYTYTVIILLTDTSATFCAFRGSVMEPDFGDWKMR